jgi:hypothetical protein
MYSLPRLRAAHASISIGATLAYLAVLAALIGGLILLHVTGGEEAPILDARATQAVEPAFTVVPAELPPAVVTTDELPEEMAPTF